MFIPLIDPHPRSRPGDGFVSRHLNRWISSCISELLLRTHISPNQVSLVIALLAIPMILLGAYGHLILAAGLWQLISALDGIDGEIARAKGLSTRFGALLDTTLDYTIDSIGALSIGIAILVQSNVPSPVILSIVVMAITARLITNFVVKSVPQGCRRGVLPENRCITVFLIFLGAIAAELSSVWVVLATLLVASTVRVGNCVKTMARF